MRDRQMSKLFSILILLAFCITGIYQSFDMADSFFVRSNENVASLYEQSIIDHTQEAILEDFSLLNRLVLHRKDQRSESYMIHPFSNDSDLYSDIFTKYSDTNFTEMIEENCINHFSSSVITTYIHQKDGQKIA